MSVFWTQMVWEEVHGEPPEVKLLMLAIADQANRAGICAISNDQLAISCGFGTTAKVEAAIEDAIASDFLVDLAPRSQLEKHLQIIVKLEEPSQEYDPEFAKKNVLDIPVSPTPDPDVALKINRDDPIFQNQNAVAEAPPERETAIPVTSKDVMGVLSAAGIPQDEGKPLFWFQQEHAKYLTEFCREVSLDVGDVIGFVDEARKSGASLPNDIVRLDQLLVPLKPLLQRLKEQG